jgi:DnaJ-class molecular chaperone
MPEDLYKTLNVPRTASQDDIRKSYRKLAKELHPDLNPGDKAAEERFKKVSAAFGILGDADKRARYDRGEIDASGQERPEQRFYREYAGDDPGFRYRSNAGYRDFSEFSDVFGDLFGKGRGGQQEEGRPFQARGPDARYRLEVEFLDAIRGDKKRITLPEGGTLDLTIPAGTRDGDVLRLKGKGGQGLGGGPAGDAMVEIAVKPHAVFARDGDDIQIEGPITLDEAVLGGKIEVPTVSGRVTVTVPKGASTGQTLRLKGQGAKSRSGAAGDQLVKLKVVMPEAVDPDLEAFVREWRAKHAYDPRRRLREQAT